MLELIDLTQQRGHHSLLGGLCASLRSSELMWVRGANGSGKTSLLRICAGLARPATGRVLWQGQPLALQPSGVGAPAHVVWVGHRNGCNERLSPVETLHLECRIRGLALSEGALIDALHASGLKGHCDVPIQFLSQGQKRRVALSRLRLPQPRDALWLLDEPFAGLDAQGAEWLHRCIERHVGAGGLVMVTAHDQDGFAVPSQKTLWLDAQAQGVLA